MSEYTKTVQVGPGFFTLLALLFVGLKLGGVINWSWWLVLLPLYGGIVLALAILAIVGVVFSIAALGDTLGRRLR